MNKAHRELLQAPNTQARYDVARSHLSRIERSINPKLLQPETRLLLDELRQTLNHEISMQKHESILERLNTRSALITAFSHQFVTPMPNSKEDLTQIVANTKKFSGLLMQQIVSPMMGGDPVAINAAINALKKLSNGAEALADYQYRVRSLGLSTQETKTLNQAYRSLYTSVVAPRIGLLLEKLKDNKPQRKSVLQLPDGKTYYETKLRQSSDLLANDIHTLGLKELTKLHQRIEVLSGKSIQNVFRDNRDNPANYFPNSATGRQQYLNKVHEIIEHSAKHFDIPLHSLTVKAVDTYRSEYATTFDYFGSTLHINLSNMKNLPRYELMGQVRFHSIPGLHLATEKGGSISAQIAFSSYLSIDPMTKNLNALMYLVDNTSLMIIDTGIHALGWSELRAIDFMAENTALPKARILQYVDEAYMEPGRWAPSAVGRLKIHQLAEHHGIDFAAMSQILIALGTRPITLLKQHLVEHQSHRLKAKPQDGAVHRLRSGLPPR